MAKVAKEAPAGRKASSRKSEKRVKAAAPATIPCPAAPESPAERVPEVRVLSALEAYPASTYDVDPPRSIEVFQRAFADLKASTSVQVVCGMYFVDYPDVSDETARDVVRHVMAALQGAADALRKRRESPAEALATAAVVALDAGKRAELLAKRGDR